MDRQEHLEWCKKRALEHADKGNLLNAYASMVSDLNKHSDTTGHSAIGLGMMLMEGGHLETSTKMRDFIMGFN